jgi:xanthine dehydrogenase YagT iron-sulfur-binding subunit
MDMPALELKPDTRNSKLETRNHHQFQEGAMAQQPDEKNGADSKGVTRRGFLSSVGVGALSVGASAKLLAAPSPADPTLAATEKTRINLLVNRRRHALLVEPRWTLLYLLREHLGLTGTKVGCERGECGACTVLINGIPRYACLTLAVECEGLEITTLEGLMQGEELGPVQQAFLEQDAFQCGYCTPGQIMAVEGLLRVKPNPTLDQIQAGVSGNLCRCGAYANIFKAARLAAERKAGKRGES